MKIALATVLVMMLWIGSTACGQATNPPAQASHSIDLRRLQRADRLIDDAIATGKCPGAVLLVGQGDQIVYRKAYGLRAIEPEKIAASADTIYDMASLTKVIATAPCIMMLVDGGKLKVTDTLAKYIPEFGVNGKQEVTIEQLLLHCGGLMPDDPMSDYEDGPAQAWKNIYSLELTSAPGKHFAYSDVGFIMLGKLVEIVSGQSLDIFAREHLFAPLKMSHTAFNPPESWRPLCAPTQLRDGHWMLGQVHDPRSFALGGVAGHAGLFSTADDLSRYCRMLLHHGTLDGVPIIKEFTFQKMIQPRTLPDDAGSRGYGFDIDTAYSGPRGDRFERGSTFGHTGFTGTSFWVDPIHQCYVILLTNSVHPAGEGNVLQLRHDVGTIVADALLSP